MRFVPFLQAVVAPHQACAPWSEPGPGQREDARRAQVQHPQVCPDRLPPRHAASQQSTRRAEQRLQRERLTLRGAPALGAHSVQLACTGEGSRERGAPALRSPGPGPGCGNECRAPGSPSNVLGTPAEHCALPLGKPTSCASLPFLVLCLESP